MGFAGPLIEAWKFESGRFHGRLLPTVYLVLRPAPLAPVQEVAMLEIFVAAVTGGAVGCGVTLRLFPRYIARLPKDELAAFARRVATLRGDA